MSVRNVIIGLSALMLSSAYAQKGSFEFSTSAQKQLFDVSCIKSLHYLKPVGYSAELLSFELTDSCGESFYKFTNNNMGKNITLTYKGNVVQTSMIFQVLKSHFSVPTEDAPRVVIMQIINDYGASIQ